MPRKTRRCKCGGTMYLRTSHRGKAGTYRCVRCGRIERDMSTEKNYIILGKICNQCGENLRIKYTRIVEDRIPYCPIHGEVN